MTSKSVLSPKIIINGCSNVGQRLARFCDMKGYEIVAAYNRAGDKIGKDLGQLAGLNKNLGVIVQDVDTADLSGVDANIALIAVRDYMDINYPYYEKYLSAGINVLCHGAQAYDPWFNYPEMAAKIDKLAKDNGVTFTGGGIWDSTRLWSAIIAAGPCIEIESITHTAQAEIGRPGGQWEAVIGVGTTVDEFNKKFAGEKNSLSDFLHGPAVMVLKKLGCTIKEVKKNAVPIVFEEPVYSPHSKNTFPAGIVIGTRCIVDVTTEEGITGRVEVEYRLFREGEIETINWDVKGMPGLGISIRRDDTQNLSASSLFNRIPDVLAAEPGIVTITEMNPLSSSALI